MKTKRSLGWAVVYSYETMGGSREDVMDSWFMAKSAANTRLVTQQQRNPKAVGSFYVCPVECWQDDNDHWHVKRAQR